MAVTDVEAGEDDAGPTEFSSPPCFLHELDAGTAASLPETNPERRAAILRWRREERVRLLEERLAMASSVRADHAARIAAHLDTLLPDVRGKTISLYWPLRGEPNLRGWADALIERGARCALPVVAEKNRPLVFHGWKPGDPLVRGFWNIPVPEKGEALMPDVTLAPVVGFDERGYRLGYGGGYFDRTLAALKIKPCVIGVGYAQAAIPTIFPLDHDIALDAVVTERGVEDYGRRLRGITSTACGARPQAL
jgi:5-formyltetrahydrofolate cyclo-ligase